MLRLEAQSCWVMLVHCCWFIVVSKQDLQTNISQLGSPKSQPSKTQAFLSSLGDRKCSFPSYHRRVCIRTGERPPTALTVCGQETAEVQLREWTECSFFTTAWVVKGGEEESSLGRIGQVVGHG